jgi:hypothetical protein
LLNFPGMQCNPAESILSWLPPDAGHDLGHEQEL